MTTLDLIKESLAGTCEIDEVNYASSRDRVYEYRFTIWGWLDNPLSGGKMEVLHSNQVTQDVPLTSEVIEKCHTEVLKDIFRNGIYYRQDFLASKKPITQ